MHRAKSTIRLYLYRDSGTKAEYIHIMDTILVKYEIFAPSFEWGGNHFLSKLKGGDKFLM